jgi:hypothetical protein
MRSSAVAPVILCARCGSATAFAPTITTGLTSPEQRLVVLAQAQSPSQRTAKQRRRPRKLPSSSSESANPPPASSKGFDPKKIWESD